MKHMQESVKKGPVFCYLSFIVLIFVLIFDLTFLVAQVGFVNKVTVPELVARYPEIIVFNAKVVTMDDSGANENPGTIVEAMAIRDGEIMALGSSGTVLEYAGPQTKKLDLKGRTILPGLIDTHIHIHNSALSRWMDENPASAREAVGVFSIQGATPDELRRRIEVVLRENVPSLGENKWAFLNLPTGPQSTGTGLGVRFVRNEEVTQQELDQWAPKNPVLVVAHPNYMVNSRGMEEIKKIYNIEPDLQMPIEEGHATPLGFSPVGVEFRRAVIVDGYFRTNVPLLADIILGGLNRSAAMGITTFSSHIHGINNFNAYIHLLRKYGRLPIRFGYTDHAGFHSNPQFASDFYLRLGDRAGFGNDFFWQAAISSGFIDSGPPAICSSVDLPAEQKKMEWCRIAPGTAFSEAIYDLLARGQRIANGHNYGDKSADYFMDLLERGMGEVPGFTLDYVRQQRFTMDHCGLYPRPDQLPRMKRLGIILSCDTGGLRRIYPWLKTVYGMDKVEWIAPIKNILNAGVEVAWAAEGGLENGIFSSFTPFVTRKNPNGEVVAANQAVDRVTVMKMATSWAARFMVKEDVMGMLKPGYWGDFIVLSQDYFTIPLEEVDRIIPLMTVVGGEVVFLRDSLARELGQEPVGTQYQYPFEEQ